jgi:RNA polymerase sigma factor (sigma-70 family)
MGLTRSRCRYAHTLFNFGSIGGLTDGELLSLFASRRDEAGELAFAVLVERHGPMVLRVCRSILRDEHDAQDAVQATFLVLVRRCGAVRKRDSIGSWLHGVALRVAGCARTASARRWVHERRAAAHATADVSNNLIESDVTLALHEELDRLPERQRAVIVLCYLEGLACDVVASRLGLPVGTVKSRLARGRERLRGRLVRRGLAPSAGLLGTAGLAQTGRAVFPARLVGSISRTAVAFAAGEAASAGAVSAWVAVLTRKVVLVMSLRNYARFAGVLLALAAASIGIAAFAQRSSPEQPKVKGTQVASGEGEARNDGPARLRPESVLEKALVAADQITVPWAKAYAFADIAVAQARIGQAAQAKVTFRRSAEIIEKDPGDASFGVTKLARLAKARAMAGDRAATRTAISEVLKSVARIDDADEQRNGLECAARWQAEAGNAEGVLELLGAMKNVSASKRAYILAETAGAQAKAGDLPGARVTMARAEADAERAENEAPVNANDVFHAVDAMRLAQVRGMAPFAMAAAKAGDIQGARAALARARVVADRVHDEWRPEPLAQVAMAYKRAGDEKRAEEILRAALAIALGLPQPGQRIAQLARVAIVQGDSGDRQAGRETLDQAILIVSRSPLTPGSLEYQCFSAAKARVGEWAGAREFALSQTDFFLRAAHVEGLCFEQAKAGEERDALAWADALTDPLIRANALLGVVRGIIEHKMPSDAK